jgi:hypothetical protein
MFNVALARVRLPISFKLLSRKRLAKKYCTSGFDYNAGRIRRQLKRIDPKIAQSDY